MTKYDVTMCHPPHWCGLSHSVTSRQPGQGREIMLPHSLPPAPCLDPCGLRPQITINVNHDMSSKIHRIWLKIILFLTSKLKKKRFQNKINARKLHLLNRHLPSFLLQIILNDALCVKSLNISRNI